MVELDGLRGLAVLLVIASHTNLWQLRGAGAIGVWLFFVLSAFLLTKIMLANIPASLGWVEMARYLIRRVARILPAYYLYLALVGYLDGNSMAWFFEHCLFLRADGHLWSIPQEEVFYLALPALVALACVLYRWLRLPLPIAAGLLVAVVYYRPPSFALPGNGSWIPFYLKIFMLGFFLAHLWKTNAAQRFRLAKWFLPIANITGVVALLVLVSGGSREHLAYYSRFIPVPVDYLGWTYSTAFAAISAVLVLVTLVPGSWLQRIFASAALRIIGVLSFSLYLVHYRIHQVLAHDFRVPAGFPLFMGTLLLSLLIALAFERFIERPSIHWGRRINSRLKSGRGNPA